MPKLLNRNEPLRRLMMLPVLLLAVGACSSQPPATTPPRDSETKSTSADNQHAAADSSAIDESDFAAFRRVFEQVDSLPGEDWEGSLRELIENLNKRTKTCVKVDEKALSDERLSQELMIRVENQSSLLLGLRLALRAVKLDVILRDGCLLITSAVRAADTQYRGTLSLAPLLNEETPRESALLKLQTADPESVWLQVHGLGG